MLPFPWGSTLLLWLRRIWFTLRAVVLEPDPHLKIKNRFMLPFRWGSTFLLWLRRTWFTLRAVVLEPDPHLNLQNLKTMDLTTGTARRVSSTTFFKCFMDCRVGETLRQIFWKKVVALAEIILKKGGCYGWNNSLKRWLLCLKFLKNF